MTLPELFEATCNFDYTHPDWEARQMDLIHKAIDTDRVCYLPDDWIEKAEAEADRLAALKKEILDAKADKSDKDTKAGKPGKDKSDKKETDDDDSEKEKAESDKPADEKAPVEKPKDPTLADTGKSALKKAAELLRLVADTFEKADAAHQVSLVKAAGNSPADDLEARAAEILK